MLMLIVNHYLGTHDANAQTSSSRQLYCNVIVYLQDTELPAQPPCGRFGLGLAFAYLNTLLNLLQPRIVSVFLAGSASPPDLKKSWSLSLNLALLFLDAFYNEQLLPMRRRKTAFDD